MVERAAARSVAFDGGLSSTTRSRISSERRCGGRKLSRLATAVTWRCMGGPSPGLALVSLAVSVAHAKTIPRIGRRCARPWRSWGRETGSRIDSSLPIGRIIRVSAYRSFGGCVEVVVMGWPLCFTYNGSVIGKGFVAHVDLCGRLLAIPEADGVWMHGVNPG